MAAVDRLREARETYRRLAEAADRMTRASDQATAAFAALRLERREAAGEARRSRERFEAACASELRRLRTDFAARADRLLAEQEHWLRGRMRQHRRRLSRLLRRRWRAFLVASGLGFAAACSGSAPSSRALSRKAVPIRAERATRPPSGSRRSKPPSPCAGGRRRPCGPSPGKRVRQGKAARKSRRHLNRCSRSRCSPDPPDSSWDSWFRWCCRLRGTAPVAEPEGGARLRAAGQGRE